jgi:hypothetical protein
LLAVARAQRKSPPPKDNAGDTHRIFAWAEQKIRESKTGDELYAPLKAIELMRDAIMHGEAHGYEAETRAFMELRRTPAAENLMGAFFARQAARKSS